MSAQRGSPKLRLAAIFGLVVMATWTLAVKFLAPIVWAYAERAAGRPAFAPIMWDFWWIAHLALAWLLWHRHRWARSFGLIVAGFEIAIVSIKFAFYFQAPDLSFWRLLWFTNKVYVLAFFVAFAVWLFRPATRREFANFPRGGGYAK